MTVTFEFDITEPIPQIKTLSSSICVIHKEVV